MSKKYAIFLICLFAAFLGVFFVVNAATPAKEFSPMENRTLAQMPALTAKGLTSGDFMADFETYVTDQFTLRDQWIALKAASERALGKQENNGVYLASNDTLIARFDPPATDRARKRIDQNFAAVDAFAQKSSVPVYFALIPGKVSVWADRLPAGAPNDDELTYITRGSQSASARWIDVNTAMNAHRDEEIYYRTDHHWSSLGAYYGYEALVKGMGLTPTPLSAYDRTTVSTDFFGTSFSTSGVRWVKPDVIELFVPQENAAVVNYYDSNATDGQLYNMDQLQEKDKYSMFLGGNKPLTILKSNVAPADAPKLLIIRDSYSDSLAPFLTDNFSEIHLVDPRYYKNSPSAYVQENGIDMALVLYSVSNFVNDGNLFVLGM